MDSKRFAAGTIVGGIVLYVVGWLLFTKAMGAYYAANAGTATGVARDGEILWAMLVGNLAYAALVTYTVLRGGQGASVTDGAKIGAIVGFLMWCTADFVFFGSTNIANLTRTIVDPVLEIIHGGIGGAAIAATLARMTSSTSSAS